jgi:hypothetical protein
MRIRLFAAVGGLVLASTSAFANNVTNDITGAVLGDTVFFGALHSDSFDFTDTFNFTIAGTYKVSASLTTIGAGVHNIDFLSANLNGQALTFGPTGFAEAGSTVGDLLVTGPIVLTVAGKSGAAGGNFASYSGTMNITVADVPIPGAIWMFGSGLVALLAGARRRIFAG